MNRYPNNEMSLGDIFNRSVRLHYLTLKHTILCIFFITIVKYISMILIQSVSTQYQYLIYVIAATAIVYFFSAALFATHRAFIDESQSIRVTLKTIWHRAIQIYTTFAAYIIGIILVDYLSKLLVLGIDKIFHQAITSNGVTLIVTTILVMVYIATFYFAFPITVIDEKPAHKAFYISALLTEKTKFAVLISFMILSAVILLLTPGMINEYLLSTYHLDALFDFVVLCVAVPLYINLLLFIIHDAKQQVVLE